MFSLGIFADILAVRRPRVQRNLENTLSLLESSHIQLISVDGTPRVAVVHRVMAKPVPSREAETAKRAIEVIEQLERVLKAPPRPRRKKAPQDDSFVGPF
jgi:hypothetical protein